MNMRCPTGSNRSEIPLTGSWKFFEPKSKRWLPATVPGCVHLDLRSHGLIPDPFWGSNELDLQWIEHVDWKYRTEFSVSNEMLSSGQIDLVADGLDTLATVLINGREIARTENMFTSYRFPVRSHLQKGRNELEIRFASTTPYIAKDKAKDHYAEWNDPVGGCSVIRKEQCQLGWDWGSRFVTAGIYKRIALECWSENRIDSLRIGMERIRAPVA